jgi:hypothetical protein
MIGNLGPQARKADWPPAATQPLGCISEDTACPLGRASQNQNNFRRSMPTYSPTGSITKDW